MIFTILTLVTYITKGVFYIMRISSIITRIIPSQKAVFRLSHPTTAEKYAFQNIHDQMKRAYENPYDAEIIDNTINTIDRYVEGDRRRTENIVQSTIHRDGFVLTVFNKDKEEISSMSFERKK